MDGCAGVNTQMVRRSGPTSRRRLPTAADEADMVIGVRGVLGSLNATPATKNRALGPCRTRAIRPAVDNPTRPIGSVSQPCWSNPAAGKRALQLFLSVGLLLVEPVELISFVGSQRMLRGIRERAERAVVSTRDVGGK